MFRWCLAIALVAIAAAPGAAQAPPDGATGAPPATPTNVVTKAPRLLQAVAPDYPPAALAAGKTANFLPPLHFGNYLVLFRLKLIVMFF